MFLRFQVSIGIDGMLEREDSINDRMDFARRKQAVHIFESFPEYE